MPALLRAACLSDHDSDARLASSDTRDKGIAILFARCIKNLHFSMRLLPSLAASTLPPAWHFIFSRIDPVASLDPECCYVWLKKTNLNPANDEKTAFRWVLPTFLSRRTLTSVKSADTLRIC